MSGRARAENIDEEEERDGEETGWRQRRRSRIASFEGMRERRARDWKMVADLSLWRLWSRRPRRT